jgi:hypothetical protein
MSSFDPKAFASMTFKGANSTESVPIPVGEWLFDITKADIEAWSNKEKTNGGLRCVMLLETTAPEVKAVTGRDKNSVKYEFLLDLTPEGGLDMSKGMNVTLGRARAATNLNRDGEPFMFEMFVGKQVKAAVVHEMYQDRAKARVKGIANPNAQPTTGDTGAGSPKVYTPGG